MSYISLHFFKILNIKKIKKSTIKSRPKAAKLEEDKLI
jgi:hypothetical protein